MQPDFSVTTCVVVWIEIEGCVQAGRKKIVTTCVVVWIEMCIPFLHSF